MIAAPFLARSQLLAEATPEARAQLARSARRRDAARGTLIYAAGARADGVYVVASGWVALVLHESPARESIVHLCGPGESFGEEELAAGACMLSARAVSPALLVHLPREDVLEAMARHPSLTQCALRSVSRRVLQAAQLVGAAATRSALQRLAGYLLRGIRPDEPAPAKFTLGVPKGALASLLGVTRETLSRLLAQLAGRGLLELRGRTIRILRPDGLAELCHGGGGCARCCGCPRGAGWDTFTK
jgi:CRP/FNR family transcriptional regulator